MTLPALPDDPTLLHALFAALPGNFILLRPDSPTYTIVAMSAELLRQTGREAEEVVGQSVFVAYPENPEEAANNGPAQMRSALEASLRDQQSHELPLVRYDVLTPGGIFEERYWWGSSKAVLDGQGQVRYLLFTSVDLTAQRRANHEQQARQQAEQRNRDLEARVQERTRQLHEQGQRLERLFRQAPAAICILSGSDLVYELVNPVYQQLFPDRQLLGKPLLAALPELTDHAAYHTMRRVFDTGESIWQQALHTPLARTADGVLEDRYFNYVQQPRYDEQGRVDGVLVFGFEVTELVQARQRIEESREELKRFQFMADQARDPFILMRADGSFAYLNQRALEAWGYTAEEMQHLRVPDLDPIYQEGPFNQLFARAQHEIIPQFETLHRRKDGHVYPVEVSAAGLQLDGQPHLLVVARDVTAQQRYVATLQESEARFRTMADAAPNLVWAVHPDSTVRYINRAFLDFVGLDHEQQYLATGWGPYLHPDELELTQQTLTQAIAQRQPYVLEHRMRRHDGQYRWLLAQGAPSYLADGELYGYVGSAIDITDLKQANEQLRRTNADLDNFIYTASHDLKAPISNIEGLLHAVEQELPPDYRVGEVSTMLQLMQQAVERFRRTIAHLTDISRLQQEYDQPAARVRLAQVVHEVQLDLAPLVAQTAARLEVHLPEDLTLNFSEKNLRSVVYNLLSNALKYRHPDRQPEVALTYTPQVAHHVLEVRDNGLGLDLGQDQDKLFGMFKRLHTHVEGSGVGLYMVKKIVENAGGRIEVESILGQGSAFRIYLPC